MKGARMEGSSDIRELNVLGDWAYLRSHIAITITPPVGELCRRTSQFGMAELRAELRGRSAQSSATRNATGNA